MREFGGYRASLFLAVLLHVLILYAATRHYTHKNPVLAKAKNPQKTLAQVNVPEAPHDIQPIQAVSVDSQEVMAEISRLKSERLKKQQAEEQRQKRLAQRAEEARLKRIQEQKKLDQIKRDAAKAERDRTLRLEQEKKRLAQLAKQKAAEEKELADVKAKAEALKQKHEEEQKKLAALKQKELDEAKAKEAAARQHRVAGEVNKYKALIVGAIGQQWIVPDRSDRTLSSQFRIKLAPNGAVLEVSLMRSSGDPILDRSAQTAIYKASPLPVPTDPELFNMFRDISLTVRPESARG